MGLIPPNPPPTSYFSRPIISNSDMQELKTGISEKMIKPLIRWAGRKILNLEMAPRSQNKMTFHEAQMYCLFCRHNGKKNWRLPTRLEWETINGWETPVWLVEKDNVVTDKDWYAQPVRDKK
jgi:formylglycine-generating enzyme required for sulfatase activity